MKYITSSLVLALLFASGDDLISMKAMTIKTVPTGKFRFAELQSESDSSDSSGDSDAEDNNDAQVEERLAVDQKLFMASRAVKDINEKVKELDGLI